MIVSPRSALFAFALLAFAVTGHAAEPEKKAVAPLVDAEVRAHLQGEEIRDWEKLQARRLEATRQIARGKDIATPRKADLKGGLGSESNEARKARGEAIFKEGEARLAELDRERANFADIAEARIRGTAVSVRCPIVSLKDAFTQGVTELHEAASGFTEVVPLGVVLTVRQGTGRDANLSALLAETYATVSAPREPAPGAEAKPATDPAAKPAEAAAKPVVKPEPKGAARTGWLVGEIRPCESAKGAVVSFRLIDKTTGRVIRATLALVPADPNDIGRRSDGETEPPAFRAALEDTQNFFSKLGQAERWTFEVEGADAAACVARATIAACGAPALGDSATLKVLGGAKPDRPDPVKAYWLVAADPETGMWRVSTRVAARAVQPLPVGRLPFGPAPTEKK